MKPQPITQSNPAGFGVAVLLAIADLRIRPDVTLGEVLGPRLIADTGEWGAYAWANYVLSTPGMRIGGGTEEIVRNTIGERVLGLPREPKA